jgi:REP element-mobilizing transposase RayT
MANSYHKVIIQAIFVVKFRQALIKPEWKNEFQGVIGNLINEKECQTIIVNGVEDHVHCLFTLKPSIALTDLMKSVKSRSSKWLNQKAYLNTRFEWQPGCGYFSYSKSHMQQVYRYISNQEEHHKKESFMDEYLKLLKNFEIDFEDEYLFHEPK